MKNYYPIAIRYQGRTVYAIWFTLGSEGLICENEKLLIFSDTALLFRYASQNEIDIDSKLHKSYDLDDLADFIQNDDRYANASTLDFWSFFCDLSSGLHKPFAGDSISFFLNDIYEKLCFSGIDFTDITDEEDGSRFDLTCEEESITKAVLKTGLTLFDKYRVEWKP